MELVLNKNHYLELQFAFVALIVELLIVGGNLFLYFVDFVLVQIEQLDLFCLGDLIGGKMDVFELLEQKLGVHDLDISVFLLLLDKITSRDKKTYLILGNVLFKQALYKELPYN